MGAAEQDRKELLTRLAADFLARSKEGGPPAGILNPLRDEIKKTVGRTDERFWKFRGLLELFRDVIPDVIQRYNTAVKALSTTSALGWQDILDAAGNQLDELKRFEEEFMAALPDWHEEIRGMESELKGIKDEILESREKIKRLEKKEQEVLREIAAREKEMGLAEKGLGDAFMDVRAEIAGIKEKIEELFASGEAQSLPQPAQGQVEERSAEQADGAEAGIPQIPAQRKAESGKCPVCGSQMVPDLNDKSSWMCYICAYKESRKDDAASMFARQLPLNGKKTCPVCRKEMDWHEKEKFWQCPHCEYKRMDFHWLHG